MPTYITHYSFAALSAIILLFLVCRLASPMCTLDPIKYANIHHPGIYLNCFNQVCQLISPIIPLLHWVQLYCFFRVCRLASPMCALDPIKYANIHHPGIYLNGFNQVCQLKSLSYYPFAADIIVLLLTCTSWFTVQWGWKPFTQMFIDDWYMLGYYWDQVQSIMGDIYVNIYVGIHVARILTCYSWHKNSSGLKYHGWHKKQFRSKVS